MKIDLINSLFNSAFIFLIKAKLLYDVLSLRSNDELTVKLRNALKATLLGKTNKEEKNAIARIEIRRSELLASNEVVEITDYGAGSKNASDNSNAESKVLRSISNVCRNASKEYFWALMLFRVAREFKPKKCIELGTCLGISSYYLGTALKLNGGGEVFTIEGVEDFTNIAHSGANELGLENIIFKTGRFTDKLDGTLKEMRSVDFAFIDGHHNGEATEFYFRKIAGYLSPGAVVVIDDIYWSAGMKSAWKNISSSLEATHALNLLQMGILIIGVDSLRKRDSELIALAQ